MRRDRGALVLEALIAGVVFASLIGLVAVTTIRNEKAMMQIQDRNAAVFLAQRELETLLSHGFPELPTLVSTYPKQFHVSRAIDGVAQDVIYSCGVQLQDHPSGELRTLIVTVGFDSSTGNKEVVLETDVHWTE